MVKHWGVLTHPGGISTLGRPHSGLALGAVCSCGIENTDIKAILSVFTAPTWVGKEHEDDPCKFIQHKSASIWNTFILLSTSLRAGPREALLKFTPRPSTLHRYDVICCLFWCSIYLSFNHFSSTESKGTVNVTP